MQLPCMKVVRPRPFLKWAGGKSQLIPQYETHFPPQFLHYYEPFLGGGAVFFHLRPQRAMLMDINPALVNVYRCIRDHVEAVIEHLSLHRDRHCQEYYYQIRASQPATPVEQAARLIYLNKTCFNGLYRENSKGLFNVPIGRYKNPLICDSDLLVAVAQALQFTQIELCPFEAVLDWASDASDFVYFDPPYHPISATSKFTAYNRYCFTEADQRRLCDVFITLARRGVKVMLSNSDCPLIRQLYQDFPIHTILAARSINSKAEKRGKITEVLVTSY